MPQRRQNSMVRTPMRSILGCSTTPSVFSIKRARDAAPAEITREREPDGAGADDQDGGVGGHAGRDSFTGLLVSFVTNITGFRIARRDEFSAARQSSAARLFYGAGSVVIHLSPQARGERSAETALGACEAPLRALGTPGRFSRRPTSLAIGTFRLSALHRGISRAGRTRRCPGRPRAVVTNHGGGNRSRLRLQDRLRRRPSMSRDAVGLTSTETTSSGRPTEIRNDVDGRGLSAASNRRAFPNMALCKTSPTRPPWSAAAAWCRGRCSRCAGRVDRGHAAYDRKTACLR